ncbi:MULTISPECIES: HAD-IIIA family hydrolase [unclassified Arthrobacter]|uniref:D-glycero-alpha-D-manno-heptose-1,7-bisphosphate 7-phosphatase n=1 Tax=unclassified Arthrobacter TaxID=235627 RepID=UPI001E57D283|nr:MULTISPECIES: HAD-IIIA family hydrolase [unclassified Arthrobacter]MCC9144363.1 HAD-IIIA family hydrolase [Arthrobacter sp. zg-Y919]MDK1275589.1 HAD-IIIA family hydrolase [Arthrobacter sp. zg.Y919]WIB03042.1 HAD-IIIA family hydrolase [Arthrobacter sp. zg-Y919]
MGFLPSPPRAVLFDRDGTLVVDVPYNADPALVQPLPGAAEVLDRLRRQGVRVGVVTNQSGIGRGMLTAAQVERVNAAVENLLGPFDVWELCPHAPGYGCICRKPRPGMVLRAARRLGLDPVEVAVIGDIGADMRAAAAAGSRGVLVPTSVTRAEETAAAPLVASDLAGAVELLWGSR